MCVVIEVQGSKFKVQGSGFNVEKRGKR